jgi:hypothetical protein
VKPSWKTWTVHRAGAGKQVYPSPNGGYQIEGKDVLVLVVVAYYSLVIDRCWRIGVDSQSVAYLDMPVARVVNKKTISESVMRTRSL